jgi:hypothetical protein
MPNPALDVICGKHHLSGALGGHFSPTLCTEKGNNPDACKIIVGNICGGSQIRYNQETCPVRIRLLLVISVVKHETCITRNI